ncbi:MAG: hypothetical protein ACE5HU_07675 [Acidobacteriota bacterium]
MDREYSIPKHSFTALVELEGLPPTRLRLFLAEAAATHTGPERPSDLLEGPNDYLPANDEQGVFHVVKRDTIRILETDAHFQDDEQGFASSAVPSHRTLVSVEVTMNDGSRLRGTIGYEMPEGRRRLQDYLNSTTRFLPLRDKDTIRFINSRCVALVTQGGRMEGTQ